MLELRNITKKYVTETLHQVALNDATIAFRETEFVSILGPSGSGKTTMLNIIGGLDQYDKGDLIINGVSTKEYKDRDWDTYRNHSIGFVFQSYNLIGHQSVLSNVEMAMTLSGVSKKERKQRAKEALERVGLADHINKKPNQLSGGQMQRVAIARALVNNPDIILADEPTGALDSETSVQIMALLKEISKNKLVIMVTHNPELAEEYSTRIVRLKDGYILDDSNPYLVKNEEHGEKPKKKTSMSFWTALSLSFNNLLTKKGRTALTSFAGSIGIIGIALILAISTGVNNYIDDVQEETLSSFPISIEKETADMSSLMSTLMGGATVAESEDGTPSEERNAIYGNPIMYKMMKSMLNVETNTNNLEKLKKYFEENKEELAQYSNAIQYSYDMKLNVYAKDPNGKYAKADFIELMNNIMEGGSMMSGISSVMENAGGTTVWQELLTEPNSNKVSNLISSQYDLIHGKWPTEKNELLLVVTPANEISDITLYSLGLVDKDTMMNATMAAMMGKEDNGWDEYEGKSWPYEDICNIPLKMVLPTDYYQYDESLKMWVDISDNQALLDSKIEKGLELKIAGIVKQKADATAPMLMDGALCYTPALVDYYINSVNAAQMIKEQKENTTTNILTGLPFVLEEEKELKDDEKIQAFKDYAKDLTEHEKATLYKDILGTPDEKLIDDTIKELIKDYEEKEAEDIVNDICKNYANELGYSEDLIRNMLSGYEKDELIELLEETVREMVTSSYEKQAEETIKAIENVPSDDERLEMKDMITKEIYKALEGKSGIERDMMMKQIQMAYILQNWGSKVDMDQNAIAGYLQTLSASKFDEVFNKVLDQAATEAYQSYAGMRASGSENTTKVAKAFDEFLEKATNEDFLTYYENNMPDKVSELNHQDLLESLGVCSLDDPSMINIYPVDFEMKEKIADMIKEYNTMSSEEDKIEYTDYVAMLMSSVTNIITAISVVLICFVSISLIVSSIMIGIITYISVLERTKEIGILRAVGASKKDVSRVFKAETAIVGLLAGLVGIGTTILLCIPLNIIARDITGIDKLTAQLPPYGYLLILLSVILTLIAGIFPARMAAKKDPVIALRSE